MRYLSGALNANYMKRIALKFGTTARIKAHATNTPGTAGNIDFSGSPLGANPPTGM